MRRSTYKSSKSNFPEFIPSIVSEDFQTNWTTLEKPLRLSMLNRYIKDSINASFKSSSYWVIAEVTNHSFNSGKKFHYFDLVEKDPVSSSLLAKIRCTAFGKSVDTIENFQKVTGQTFSNNISVLINISINYHAVYGLNLILNDISINFTIGSLEQQRVGTLNKLVANNPEFISIQSGNFNTRNKKLILPIVIQNIAVISSSNSAGCEDFLHTILNNNFEFSFKIDQFLTNVQGSSNCGLFLQKLVEVFSSGKKYDVVVIIRGGGGQTDFLLFDDYNIARAIAKFPFPVITGIGHHKNETIADIMAHTSLKTPTKVAEFIIANNKNFQEKMINLRNSIIIRSQQILSTQNQLIAAQYNKVVNRSVSQIHDHKHQLNFIKQSFIKQSDDLLVLKKKALKEETSKIITGSKIFINNNVYNIKFAFQNVRTSADHFISNNKQQLDFRKALNNSLSVENILRKGFTLIKKNKKIICDPHQINVGDNIEIVFLDQTIQSTTTNKSK